MSFECLWSYETVKSLANHGLREFNAASQTTLSGFLLTAGTFYCVKSYGDIRDGKVKNGLTKAMLGVVAVAGGIYNFVNTWQLAIEDANVVHCRWWIQGGEIPKYMQNCTVYGCDAPIPLPYHWDNDCLFLQGGRDIGVEGFKNVYDMKNAKTHYEFIF